jgi:hypothetical protein
MSPHPHRIWYGYRPQFKYSYPADGLKILC